MCSIQVYGLGERIGKWSSVTYKTENVDVVRVGSAPNGVPWGVARTLPGEEAKSRGEGVKGDGVREGGG